MATETHGMQASAVVCARCGASGDQMHCHTRRVGDGERVFWFCDVCLDPRRDAPGGTGA